MRFSVLAAGMVWAGVSGTAIAQSPIIFTETASTLGKGNLRAGVGLEYLTRTILKTEDIPSSLFRVLSGTIQQGVAENVNFDILWKGGLVADYQGRRQVFDWGDLSVWTRINFIPEKADVPAIALRTGIKLPNTRYTPTKLGNNQTDYHTQILVSKWFGQTEIRTAMGFSIIGDPLSAASQDDVYSLQIATVIRIAENESLFAEVIGRTGYQEHDDKLVSRVGFLGSAFEMRWSVFGLVRVAGSHRDFATAFDCSESWSVGMFVYKELHLDF